MNKKRFFFKMISPCNEKLTGLFNHKEAKLYFSTSETKFIVIVKK
jgi:hypothetical protein